MGTPLPFAPFMVKYIEELNRFKNNKMDDDDFAYKKNIGRVAELVTALELRMILWEDIPAQYCAMFDFPIKKDMGVDLISLDFSQTAQVKYGNNITYANMSTAMAFSWCTLNIPDLLLVCKPHTTVSPLIMTGVSKIVHLDFDKLYELVPAVAPDVIINKQLRVYRLCIKDKIDQLLAYVDEKQLPPNTRACFSNEHSMYQFWSSCRYNRKLNLPYYNRLLQNDILRKNYFDRKELDKVDAEKQIECLRQYMTTQTIDECNQLVIWQECKTENKCINMPWSMLLDNDILRADYEQYIAAYDPTTHKLLRTINTIIKICTTIAEKNKKIQQSRIEKKYICTNEEEKEDSLASWLTCDIWMQAKKNNLYNCWPYNKLQVVDVFKTDALL